MKTGALVNFHARLWSRLTQWAGRASPLPLATIPGVAVGADFDLAGSAQQQLIHSLVALVLLVLVLLFQLLRRHRQLALQRLALRATLAEHNPILSALPDLVWLKDVGGTYLFCNPAFAAALGRRVSDVVGKSDFDLHPVPRARHWRRQDQAAIESGQLLEDEEWLSLEQEGRSAYLQISRIPMYDRDGRLTGVLSTARDIAERHAMQEALRESENRFRSFFESNSSVMLLVDAESGAIIDANRAAAGFYDYSHAQLTTMSIDAINTASPEQIAQARLRALHRKCNHFEFRHRLASGELRDVDVYSTPIDSGERKLLFSVVHDVTERKRVENALQQERDLFSGGPVVVFNWSAEAGRPVRQVSSNSEAVLGYTKAEITDPRFRFVDLIHPLDVERVEQELATRLAAGLTEFEQAYRLRRPSGSYAWFHEFTRPLIDGQGNLSGIRGYLFDQSERKALEHSLADERNRMRYVIEGTRAGTWEWNVQTGETRFNERWAEIIGYTLQQLGPISIDTWERFAHPGDLSRSAKLLEAHFRGEQAYYDSEVRMRHRDGHWIWVQDRGRVFEWTGDGRPLWIAGTHQDITERKLAEQALLESEQRLSTAGRAAYDLIYEWDIGSSQLRWFGDVDGMLGFPAGEISASTEQWLALIHPDDAGLPPRPLAGYSSAVHSLSCEYRIRHRDGSYRNWLDKSLPTFDADGQLFKWIGVCTDITERKQAEEKLRLAATVFDHAAEGIIVTDEQARIIDVNRAFSAITGYHREEVLGHKPNLMRSGRHGDDFYRGLWGALLDCGRWTGEIWNRRSDGEIYPQMLAISAVHDQHGRVCNYVALFSDNSAQKQRQTQLEHIAYSDPLTGLPNRTLLADRLRQAMLRTKRNAQRLAVAYLDLDGFKAVNDEHGHEVGDQLLIEVSKAMNSAMREGDSLVRLGGDEFVALLVDLPSDTVCEELLRRLLATASRPLQVSGRRLAVSASLGVTFYPQTDDVDADQLLRQADQAMYQAKLAGKNRYDIFDPEHDRSLRTEVETVEDSRDAPESPRPRE